MISIIVPLYNAANYIEKTIETVTAQTYKDWELILVDDLSKDNSVETVKKCLAELDKETASKIRLIEKPVNEQTYEFEDENTEESVSEVKGNYQRHFNKDGY